MSIRYAILWAYILTWSSGDTRVQGQQMPRNRTSMDYRLPALFTPNAGQWNSRIRFAIQEGGDRALLCRDGFTILHTPSDGLTGGSAAAAENPRMHNPMESALTIKFKGARGGQAPEGRYRARTIKNFFLGSDRSRWKRNVPTYREVTYRYVWKGVDVSLGENRGKLQQKFMVHSGAHPEDILMTASRSIDFISNSQNRIRIGDGNDEFTYVLNDAYQVLGADTVHLRAKFSLRPLDGGYGFSCRQFDPRFPLFFDTEFSTRLGGSGIDAPSGIETDEEGNAYVCGTTRSADFPVANAFQSHSTGLEDIFISKFSCDGQALLFSSYLGGSNRDVPHGIMYGDNKELYIYGDTKSLDFPVTGDALQKGLALWPSSSDRDAFIVRISEEGVFLYGTYFGGRDVENDIRGSLMANGDFCMAFSGGYSNQSLSGTGEFPYITANAFNREGCEPTNYATPIVTIFNPSCTQVKYCSYINKLRPTGSIKLYNMAVNSRGHIILTGLSRGGLPVKNAYQDTLHGFIDAFVFCLDPRANQLVFSTYLGGNYGERGIALYVDQSDKIYLYVETESMDFPKTTVWKNTDSTLLHRPFLSKFDPAGHLLFSSDIQLPSSLGNSEMEQTTMRVDRCGNVYLTGYYEPKPGVDSYPIPIVDPRVSYTQEHGYMIQYLALLDSSGAFYKASTCWAKRKSAGRAYPYTSYAGWFGPLLALRNGYVYLTGVSTDSLPLFRPFQSAAKDTAADIFLSKLYMPACNTLPCAIHTVDSVRIERTRGKVQPHSFVITATVTNPDSLVTMDSLTVELLLPDGVRTDSSSSPTLQNLVPATLAPFASGSASWSVIADSTLAGDSCFTVAIIVRYRRGDLNSACFIGYAKSTRNVQIKYFEEKIDLACSLDTPDTLRINPSGTGYEPNPVTVTCTLHNIDTKRASLRGVSLFLPPGMKTVPSGDAFRTLPALAVGDSAAFTWQVHASGSRWVHDARIAAAAIDTNGWEQSRCEKVIVLPSIPNEVSCTGVNPDTLRFNKTTGSYAPDPFRIVWYLQNNVDTMQTIVEGEISLAHAPHLEIGAGEMPLRTLPFISASGREPYAWKLRVKGILLETVTDTIRMRYRTAYDSTWRSCILLVVIERANISALLACVISGADTLQQDGDTLRGNPALVSFTAKNIGILPAQLKDISLDFAADPRVASLDPLVLSAGALPAGDSLAASWRLRFNTSRFERRHTLRVTVTDTSGAAVISCEKSIFIQPVIPAIVCNATAPDTLRFDKPSQRYNPDPFIAGLKLDNKLDTSQTNIDAVLDLSGAPHLALASGQAARLVPLIAEHAAATEQWDLTVASNARSDCLDTLIFRYRLSPQDPWQECRHLVFIEAEKKIARAGCASAGPDTVWNVRQREKLAPNPILVRYTLSNSGTMTLSNCSVAILLPGLFSIEQGTDSVQSFGPIPYGTSETHEWLLNVTQPFAIDTSVTIRWRWSCAELAQDTTCDHALIFTTKEPPGLLVTPWVVHFRAKQNDPLPPALSVSLVTPVNVPLAWQATTSLPWLDIQPATGDSPANIALRPNTTALPIGNHTGALTFAPAAPYLSTDVKVEYEIYTILDVRRENSPKEFALDQNYPNPFSGETTISFTLASPARVTLAVYDLFGRSVAVPVEEEREAGKYIVKLRSDALHLLPGVYMYTLSAGGRRVARRMAVVR